MQITRHMSVHRRSYVGWLGGLYLLGMVFGLDAFGAGGSFADGRQAYLQKDYQAALRIWSALADQGDREAQFGLGTLYFEGSAVPKNSTEANRWFGLAAEQGYAPAQFNLGNAYRRGDAVEQNDALANEWWRKAADQEFAPAQFNLATQYYYGRGVPRDRAIALIFYRRSAENGHPSAPEVLRRLEAIEQAEAKQAEAGKADEGTEDSPAESVAESRPETPVVEDAAAANVAASPETAPARPEPSPAPTHTGAKLPAQSAAAIAVARTAPPPGGKADWIRSSEPSWFTAQLVSLGSEASAKAFIAKHAWTHPVGYVSVVRSGQRRYSVLYGSFPDRTAAERAVAQLPAGARTGGKPWIRRLKGIQSELP